MSKIGDGDEDVQTSCCKISKSWGYNVVNIVNSIVKSFCSDRGGGDRGA